MIDDGLIKVLQSRIDKLEVENNKLKEKYFELKNLLKNLKTRFANDNTWSNYFSDVIDEILEE
jgi:dynactin complex subunit